MRSTTREPPSPRVVALTLYLATLIVFMATADGATLSRHTAYDHYALQADAWLHGRTDLGGPPPEYTEYNDFAVVGERYYVSFPPLPSVLIAPLVALSGSAEATRDGLFFVAIAALAPALLFLALDRLVREGLSERSWLENAGLAALFALGTVYWFSAVQGTVWYAGHAVGAACTIGYVAASVGARRPALAGLCLGLALATRPSLFFAAPLFALELGRVARRSESPLRSASLAALRFLVPLAAIGAMLAAYNFVRFGEPLEFGHRFLDVVWRPRMERWGLFSFHYVGRNLGVLLGSTPFVGQSQAPFAISGHGLALWITSPFFVWALAPRSMPGPARSLFRALALSAAAVAVVDLGYHNTGWVQFGYRFSNDYAPLLFLMIALGRRKLGFGFGLAGAFAVVVNLFGAISFARPAYARFYVAAPFETYFEPDLPPTPSQGRGRR
ncbi:MAG TPA: hypothetical protein VL400_20560 [Polyangiaceae bacterium]|nr:hypothetical protein [Polyangiaceae bacterium]